MNDTSKEPTRDRPDSGAGSGDFLEVRHLGASYGADPAIAELDFGVKEGEFVCIVGPSGCGKSTLLQILSGLMTPTAGSVAVDGAEVVSGEDGVLGRFPHVGYVFQDHRLLPWRTVRQNLEIALSAASVPESEWSRRIKQYLKMLELEKFENAWPMKLSGGQRQRVSIARALAVDPAYILMDEPFSTLDEVTARSLRRELLELWMQTKKTTIFVTHSIREAVYLADRIVVLSRGPAHIISIEDIDVARPRDYEDMSLAKRESEIMDMVLTEWGL